MKRLLKTLYWIFLVLVFVMTGLIGMIWFRHGGGAAFPDRSKKPVLSGKLLEKVADLSLPPGNIAISQKGRIFFTFHPEANAKLKVAEWVKGKVKAYPNTEFQSPSRGKPFFAQCCPYESTGNNAFGPLTMAFTDWVRFAYLHLTCKPTN